jgi:hypothetical protein
LRRISNIGAEISRCEKKTTDFRNNFHKTDYFVQGGNSRLQDFKRLQKTSKDFMRLQIFERLQKTSKDSKGLHEISKDFMRLHETS